MNGDGTDIIESPVQYVDQSPAVFMAKVEHDAIITQAATRPRDMASVLANIKTQLATFKSFARTAMYAKPVGKDERGRAKFARGLSVRAAEAIAAAFKYNKWETDVHPLDNDTVKVTASFIDYQDGRIIKSAAIVSKLYKRAGGKGIGRHTDDRFYDVVVKAAASKLIRDCIIRMVPPGLVSELEVCVNEQLEAFLDDHTVEAMVANFASRGVTVDMLEHHVGKRLSNFTVSDRALMVKVWNAIDQGEANAAEIFDTQPEAEPASTALEQVRKSTGTTARKSRKEPDAAPPGKDDKTVGK